MKIHLHNAYERTWMVIANHGLTPSCPFSKSLWYGKGFGNGHGQHKPVARIAAGLPTNCKCCRLQSTRCSCLEWTGCWLMRFFKHFEELMRLWIIAITSCDTTALPWDSSSEDFCQVVMPKTNLSNMPEFLKT